MKFFVLLLNVLLSQWFLYDFGVTGIRVHVSNFPIYNKLRQISICPLRLGLALCYNVIAFC